jgi:hypothetical protein
VLTVIGTEAKGIRFGSAPTPIPTPTSTPTPT